MKKFKILGIIAIIAMAANFILNFEDGWSSFLEGYHEGARTYKSVPDNLYRVSLEVKPLESIANDSIFNQVAFNIMRSEKPGVFSNLPSSILNLSADIISRFRLGPHI